MKQETLIHTILAFIDSDTTTENEFNELAIELFAYQYENNLPFHQFAMQQGSSPRTAKTWRDIPPVPINAFKNVLSNFGVQALKMGSPGLIIDDNDDPFVFDIDSTDMVVEDKTESELRGDVTFIMPDGITLEGFQTANGWEKVEDEDGRQKITISLESFAAGDEFTFSVVISWWFILSQIWIYPTILISLIVWRVRARRRKKKRKRELAAAAETKVVSTGKGGLSDSDFAALSEGYDPTLPNSGDFDLYDSDDDWD